ncbi:MAG: hypothetical protein LBR16_04575 [Treponema sp.]|jgi:maltose alpha-D-glucosyltransferase/alpha-amylase|nr:hypothetical protein [Treponema sp.]
MPKWLESAVFYEIYPQTFFDSNGDGIGDIPGIIQKLDYVQSLGCNALWLNPCFDSPFKDAGYDVRDYRKVAPRYGTNEDLYTLFDEAHKRGIRVLLDLVAGHTSEEHEWFKASCGANPPAEFKNRFIWTDNWISWGVEGLRFIAGEAERNGSYITNFFKCQPSLNYGFLRPRAPWQLPIDHPDCLATREALKDIMRFWLKGDKGRGCDGFRVDMADSLVKFDDGERSGAMAVWQDVRAMLDREFPEAAIVSEWSAPEKSLRAGFHMDFLLDHEGSGYKSLVRDYKINPSFTAIEPGSNKSYFKKDGANTIEPFVTFYMEKYHETKGQGYISLITGNHDTARIAAGLEPRELALAYALIFTMPGVPFLYYGDEIGMRYLPLPTKEGGYTRTGSRSPMQWTSGKNAGFSAGPPESLYLPVDPSPDAPSVAAQEASPQSLLNTLRGLLRLRASAPELQAAPNLEALFAGSTEGGGRPFVYRRGPFVLGINPAGAGARVPAPQAPGSPPRVYAIGDAALVNGVCSLGPQSFGVWKA